MEWIELVFKPEPIIHTFGSAPPLTNLLVLDLSLNGHIGFLEVSLELSSYPINPPKKWVESKLDTVVIRFQLSGIYELNMQNWEPRRYDVRCDILLTEDPRGVIFELISENSRIKSIAAVVHLFSMRAVSGLHNEETQGHL